LDGIKKNITSLEPEGDGGGKKEYNPAISGVKVLPSVNATALL
jgi:hypothetical protein